MSISSEAPAPAQAAPAAAPAPEPAAPAPVRPAIRVKDLSKTYRMYASPLARFRELFGGPPRHRAHRALDSINFELRPGEALGLLGLNGSGKSSLLRVLSGASRPTEGICEIDGRISTLLDLAAGFNPDLSGNRNLDHAARMMGLDEQQLEQLRPQMVDFSGLGAALDDPVRTYSAGMVMRLGFSLAVHVPFDVLLIDEVLLVGDEVFQRRSLRRIRELLEAGKTIVLASHSLGDLTAVCNRLLLLDNGRQVLLGSTDEVIRAYLEDSERQARRITEGDRLLQASRVPEERQGKIRILGVDFLDADGQPAEDFPSGSPMRLRVRYAADQPVEAPLFRVQLFRNDGLWVFGSNTERGGLSLGRVEGEGAVTMAIESLNLLDADYYVSVGVWPDEYPSYLARMPYDLHDRRYVLRVRSGRPEGAGIAFCPNRWLPA